MYFSNPAGKRNSEDCHKGVNDPGCNWLFCELST